MRNMKISVVKFLSLLVAMLMLGSFSTFAQVTVTLPSVVGTSGQTASGNVTVGDLTGKNVTAFQFTITYDKSVAYITGADNVGTLSASNELTVNADTANGKISVAWASASALSGSGTLLKLNFRFRGFGNTALTLNNTFLFNAGNPVATTTNGNALTAATMITVVNTTGQTGQDILIPIHASNLMSAQNIIAYNFELTYNSSLITVTGFELANTLSAGGGAEINLTPAGTVKFAWASANNVVGTGVLVYLKAKALSVAGTANIAWTSFLFNNGTPTNSTIGGTVTLTKTNTAPTIAFSPAGPIFVTDEQKPLTFSVVGTDPGDVLTYSVVGEMPAGASLNAATGVFTWTPNYDQGGKNYSISFKVTDQGGLSATKLASIIVYNVNRGLHFTQTPADLVIVQVHNKPVYYNFTWKAVDDDGDPVIFALLAGPGGSSITTQGVFSWAPTVDQAGKTFVVTVQATDGELSVTKSVQVKGSDNITGVQDELVPTTFELLQNYPNPFNPTTTIKFGIPSTSNVKLVVMNILGEEVAQLVNRVMAAGYHQVEFNASKLNSGMYIYKIEANDFVSIKKMILIK
jgi:hypothetical protein